MHGSQIESLAKRIVSHAGLPPTPPLAALLELELELELMLPEPPLPVVWPSVPQAEKARPVVEKKSRAKPILNVRILSFTAYILPPLRSFVMACNRS